MGPRLIRNIIDSEWIKKTAFLKAIPMTCMFYNISKFMSEQYFWRAEVC